MTTVYLALGSNIGDSRANITEAIRLLGSAVQQIKHAPLYTSKAVGYADQPDFLNTAISGQTDLSPEALLEFMGKVEQQIGRTKSFRNGPREIDIDIIFYGNQVLKTSKLTLPHPRFQDRDFVLQPLCDLDPSLTDPASGQTVEQLLNKIDPSNRSILEKVDQKP